MSQFTKSGGSVGENLSTEREDRRIIGWSDPPAQQPVSKRYTSIYNGIVAELRANPGQWAQLDDRSSPSAAYQFVLGVRLGRPTAFKPPGAFEAEHDDRHVWVRYVGVEGEEDWVPEPEPVPVAPVTPPDPKTVFGF